MGDVDGQTENCRVLGKCEDGIQHRQRRSGVAETREETEQHTYIYNKLMLTLN